MAKKLLSLLLALAFIAPGISLGYCEDATTPPETVAAEENICEALWKQYNLFMEIHREFVEQYLNIYGKTLLENAKVHMDLLKKHYKILITPDRENKLDELIRSAQHYNCKVFDYPPPDTSIRFP